MDVNKELEKWKMSFSQAKTPDEKEDLQRKFNNFLNILNPEEGKAFAEAFKKGRKVAIENAKELTKEINLKVQLSDIQKIVSLSYIAKTYFGKTRTWLYQRINGNIVNGKPASFTEEEILILKNALDDICGKIQNTSRSFI